jgi:hypothetical protein
MTGRIAFICSLCLLRYSICSTIHLSRFAIEEDGGRCAGRPSPQIVVRICLPSRCNSSFWLPFSSQHSLSATSFTSSGSGSGKGGISSSMYGSGGSRPAAWRARCSACRASDSSNMSHTRQSSDGSSPGSILSTARAQYLWVLSYFMPSSMSLPCRAELLVLHVSRCDCLCHVARGCDMEKAPR